MKFENYISAKLIKHSISKISNQEIYTFELELPRCILSELHTHRGEVVFNSQSSRAVPVLKYLDAIQQQPFSPIHWGKNQSGMQAYEESNSYILYDGCAYSRERLWEIALTQASKMARAWGDAGYHKQIANRIVENFSYIKVVLSATNLSNFFHQRIHHAAEPHIRDLAIKMYEAIHASNPEELSPGQWHLPYVKSVMNGKKIMYMRDDKQITLQKAKDISVACCAQVSYRNIEDTKEKVDRVVGKLVPSMLLPSQGEPGHYSPFCHQATPMTEEQIITNSKSAQFKHWVMLRKTMDGEYCEEFNEEMFKKRIEEISKGISKGGD